MRIDPAPYEIRVPATPETLEVFINMLEKNKHDDFLSDDEIDNLQRKIERMKQLRRRKLKTLEEKSGL